MGERAAVNCCGFSPLTFPETRGLINLRPGIGCCFWRTVPWGVCPFTAFILYHLYYQGRRPVQNGRTLCSLQLPRGLPLAWSRLVGCATFRACRQGARQPGVRRQGARQPDAGETRACGFRRRQGAWEPVAGETRAGPLCLPLVDAPSKTGERYSSAVVRAS